MAEGGAAADVASLANTRDITKCCRCQHLLQDPRTLHCLHSYCHLCLKAIDRSQQDGEEGFECPQCQHFTAEKNVRVVPLLVQLLEVNLMSKSGRKTTKCERCSSKDAKWLCVECKTRNWLCHGCKNDHDDFVEHKVSSLDDLKEENVLLNKPLYCTKHKQTELDYYCLPCEKALCVKCKIEDHDSHKAVPVCDAMENKILPHINQSMDQIQDTINTHRGRAKEIEKEKEEAIERYNKQIRKHENKASEHTETLTWAKTAMAKTKGVNLFSYLQDGILERLNDITSGPDPNSELRIHASRCWPWEGMTTSLNLKRTVALPNIDNKLHPYTRIALMWNTIWMINHSTGYVYQFNTEGDKQAEFKLDQTIVIPRTAVALDSTTGIIAASSGLYTINKQGDLIKTVLPGDFSDVCFVNETIVHALEYEHGNVYSFKFLDNEIVKTGVITLENYTNENSYSRSNKRYTNSFLVKDTSIYVSLCRQHSIVQYDTAGIKRTVLADRTSRLNLPSLCGINSDNQFLIVNRNRHCVEWRSNSGKRESLINDRSMGPLFALYQSASRLWVIHDGNESSLTLYTNK